MGFVWLAEIHRNVGEKVGRRERGRSDEGKEKGVQEGKEEDWKIGRVEERNVGRWEGREVER